MKEGNKYMKKGEVDKILEDQERMAIAKIEDEFHFSSSAMATEIYRLRQVLEDKIVDNEIDREIEKQNDEVIFSNLEEK